VIFKEKGIWEVDYTGQADLPFTKQKMTEKVGAFHNTVQAMGTYILFANPNGVYAYYLGGRIEEAPLSKPVNETYKQKIISNGNWQNLKTLGAAEIGQYWIACGDAPGVLDEILIYDLDYQGWWLYGSDVSDFNISCLSKLTIDNSFAIWMGTPTDHALVYQKTAPAYADQEQAGTAVDISTLLTTNWFHFEAPSMLKSLKDVHLLGTQKGATTLEMAVYNDISADPTVIGDFSLQKAQSPIWKQRAAIPPAAGYGHMFRVSLSESAGSAGDSTWALYSTAIRLKIRGFGGSGQ
jgi:hypothetical protein